VALALRTKRKRASLASIFVGFNSVEAVDQRGLGYGRAAHKDTAGAGLFLMEDGRSVEFREVFAGGATDSSSFNAAWRGARRRVTMGRRSAGDAGASESNRERDDVVYRKEGDRQG